MGTRNLVKQRLTEPGQFVVTLEYTVPDVGACFTEDVTRLGEYAAGDDRVAGLALTDRVPTLTTHDTIDAARLAKEKSGKMPLVHLAGKNRDLDNLREQIQRLIDNDLENVLLVTGDKPRVDLPDASVLCPEGFLDSVQAIEAANKMSPDLFIAAAVCSFKYTRAAQTMQYMKMHKKIAHGARAIFNQVGLDMRKVQELALYAKTNHLSVPLVQVVPWPAMFAGFTRDDELPGVVVTGAARRFLQGHSGEADKGKGWRRHILAGQIALARAWGFAGIQLSGLKNPENIKAVLDLADELHQSKSPDELWEDWRGLWQDGQGRSVAVAPPGGFYFFPDDGRGLNADRPAEEASAAGASWQFRVMNFIDRTFFQGRIEEGGSVWKLCQWADRRRWAERGLYALERVCKYPLLRCEGCGSCSLPETAYICTESACAKKLPDGPCGGSKVRKDECEVRCGVECAWVKIYREAHNAGVLDQVGREFVPVKSRLNRHTCSWINMACQRDHRADK